LLTSFSLLAHEFINKREGTLLVLGHSPHCAFAIRRKYVSPAKSAAPFFEDVDTSPVGAQNNHKKDLEKMLAVIMG